MPKSTSHLPPLKLPKEIEKLEHQVTDLTAKLVSLKTQFAKESRAKGYIIEQVADCLGYSKRWVLILTNGE